MFKRKKLLKVAECMRSDYQEMMCDVNKLRRENASLRAECQCDYVCGGWTHFSGEFTMSIIKSDYDSRYLATLFRHANGGRVVFKEFAVTGENGRLKCGPIYYANTADRGFAELDFLQEPEPVTPEVNYDRKSDTLSIGYWGPFYRDNTPYRSCYE